MRKLLASALLTSLCVAIAPSFAGTPSFKQATSDYQAGKYQVALIEFERFREVYPTNLQVRYYEALCYQGLNQLEKAKENFQFVIDNDGGVLKSRAQAGLNQLEHAGLSGSGSTPGSSPIAAGTIGGFGRAPEAGRIRCVYEFLDKDLCPKCAAFAPHAFEASCKLTDIPFERIIVNEGSDYRVPLYNKSKVHPWLVFLDGSPEPQVLWKGILPNDANKIVAQVKRYRSSSTRVATPASTSGGSVDTARSQVSIPPPLSQTNPSSNSVNPYAPVSPY
jgi:hypothetical protein